MRQALAVVVFLVAAVAAQTAPIKARGSATAPIVLEVFSDYECPHCKLLYERTLTPLMADYADKGKVLLIHREFPIPTLHPHAVEAACYACAANRVGIYEQACEILFRDQASCSVSGKVDETVCSVLTPAEAKKVRALAKDPAIMAEVQQDVQAGRLAHIDSTPTVFLSHKSKRMPIPGNVSYQILRRYIDQLLSNN